MDILDILLDILLKPPQPFIGLFFSLEANRSLDSRDKENKRIVEKGLKNGYRPVCYRHRTYDADKKESLKDKFIFTFYYPRNAFQ